jgi:tRNA G18 (ribose-2'-O)-methylase SpoU
MRKIILLAHNLRSSHNVGSLLRTADGLGATVYLTGYTPYPKSAHDARLPHLSEKIHAQIKKTALGAEVSATWQYFDDIADALDRLQRDGFIIAALEQNKNSQSLPNYHAPEKIALIVGREVEGIELEILDRVNLCLEIPMFGQKESFNVAQSAAMALYHMRFYQQ